jgi:hypothetical protein
MKKITTILILATLLMCFQCIDDNEDVLLRNKYKVTVTPQFSFNVNDTIWVDAYLSSKAYSTSENDSVFFDASDLYIADPMSIMKLMDVDIDSNSKDAIDQFELIQDKGTQDFTGFCQNSELNVNPILTDDEQFYHYRFGLRILHEGDYFISWNHSTITNNARNESLITDYLLEAHPNQIGFDKCGSKFWRFLSETDHEYYFKVN